MSEPMLALTGSVSEIAKVLLPEKKEQERACHE
jgi:hypothetical protein